VTGGTLTLNGAADNTIVVNPTATGVGLQALSVNNGTLDLNGRNQVVGVLSSTNVLPGTGGTITNSSGTAATFTTSGTGTFGGVITGNLGFTRSGNTTTTLTSNNTYSGNTTIRGGVLQLRDAGAITPVGTPSILNYFGSLNLDSSNLTNFNSTDRVKDTLPIALQGGTLLLTGAPASSPQKQSVRSH